MKIGTFFLFNFKLYTLNFKQKIAILGIKGSYHHEVAMKVFPNHNKLIECKNFSDIPPLLVQNTVDKAVIAIENTIVGAILPNYALIDAHELQICGEYYLPIHHQLMALKGQKIENIKEIKSHPMALEQCRKFFRNYPNIRLVEARDTAYVAKQIQEQQVFDTAAIASKSAAEIYNLEIIADEIQNIKVNYTRFIIVSKKTNETTENFTKASLKFTLEHHTGSLLEILQIFRDNNLNMSKIQSLPIVEKPWEYAFFVDVIFDNSTYFEQSISKLKETAKEFKILGKYSSNKIM